MINESLPRLTVLLPAYNAAAWLREAVDSVLAQDFRDFELLAINDGSSDETGAILDSYSDTRMRVVHQMNAGLAVTLHRGVLLARGHYIARQDADDISLPGRLAAQCAWLDAHPACVIIGGYSRIAVGTQVVNRGHRHPVSNGALQLLGLFDSLFVHSAVMFRRDAALRAGNYSCDPGRNPPEDFDLWSRMAREGDLNNLPQDVLIYREMPDSISRHKAELIRARGHAIACENLEQAMPQRAASTLRDLVSCARLDAEKLSPSPDWGDINDAISDLARCMERRFPTDADEIARARRILFARVRRLRWLRHPVGAPFAKLALSVARRARRERSS